jgi:DNA-binding protein H-NS
MRKKYDYYKKMFYNEKLEKENRIKELQMYKEAEVICEVKELKAKYENLKQS